MDLTDILLLVRPGRECGSAAGVAGRLASRHGAQVQAVCLTPLPSMEPEDCYATGADAIHEVMARMDRQTRDQAARAEGPLRAALQAAGCDFTWTVGPPGEVAAETVLRARLADLVILSRPIPRADADLSLAETLIRHGASPCLLVPETWNPARPLDHAVVAWNGSRQAKRAMDDALPLLRDAATVTILRIGAAEGLERQHEALIAHLRRKGVKAAMALAPRSPYGHAILTWCEAHHADLLVMGAFGHSPRAEQWFGGTTWTVLTGARAPVLMSC